MIINQIENFSFVPERNKKDSELISFDKKPSQRINFPIIESKENDKFITFSVSHQSSLKEIYMKSKSRENVNIKEEIIFNCDNINLIDYLAENKSFSSHSDISLDSIDSDSIKTDYSD
jgi:hypothetical protein